MRKVLEVGTIITSCLYSSGTEFFDRMSFVVCKAGQRHGCRMKEWSSNRDCTDDIRRSLDRMPARCRATNCFELSTRVQNTFNNSMLSFWLFAWLVLPALHSCSSTRGIGLIYIYYILTDRNSSFVVHSRQDNCEHVLIKCRFI